MKNTLLIFAALSLFFTSCDPEPTPEPDGNPLVGKAYIRPWVDPLGRDSYYGYMFISSDSYAIVLGYEDSIATPTEERYHYSYAYPVIEIDRGFKLKVNEDYTQIQDLQEDTLIYYIVK
ncbi:MAG: hypothetical protein KL787_09945 [Taibaiella sp.]|nr:hypothetical protein [Taibaiella sp.]